MRTLVTARYVDFVRKDGGAENVANLHRKGVYLEGGVR